MMRADQMQKMHSHIFRCRREILPCVGVLHAQPSPQCVYQLEANGDVSHQLAELVITHDKSMFRQRVLPQFTGIVEKNSRQ